MSNCVSWDGVFGVIFSKTVSNKTISRLGFGDIPKNQDLGNCYQPWPLAQVITLASTLIILDIANLIQLLFIIISCCIFAIIMTIILIIIIINYYHQLSYF